jgi:hypothetical protein
MLIPLFGWSRLQHSAPRRASLSFLPFRLAVWGGEAIIAADGGHDLRRHQNILVGGPGNGRSEAVGAFVWCVNEKARHQGTEQREHSAPDDASLRGRKQSRRFQRSDHPH